MRKIFTLSSMLVMAVIANADTFTTSEGLIYDYDSETKTATIYGHRIENRREKFYQGSSLSVEKTVIINDVTYDVTRIGSFRGSPNLETLVVPEGVELSEGSFCDCNRLKDITLPEGLTHIPANCFSATDITDLSFLPSTIETIGTVDHNLAISMVPGAFQRCPKLEAVYMPTSVKYIGTHTFGYCNNLRQVNLHEGIVLIGRGALCDCPALESISIPSTMTTLGAAVFERDINLKTVSLPDGITFIGKSAFAYTSITEITIPSELESIRMGTFIATPIESLSIPAKVTRIIPAGLANMAELRTLTIMDSPETLDFDLTANHRYGRDPWPDDETQETDAIGGWLKGSTAIQKLYIGRNTATWIHPDYEIPMETRSNEDTTNPFYSMDSLESITIGPEVTDASQLVFENYANLKEITMLCKTPPILNPLTAEQASKVKVMVPEGSLDAYRNIEGWNNIASLDEISLIDNVIENSLINTQYYNLQGVMVDDSHVGPIIRVSTYRDGHTTVSKILN